MADAKVVTGPLDMIEMVTKSSSETNEAVAEEASEDPVEDTREKRGCCSFQIIFLDLLEDLVRDRFVVIFVVLFLLTMIVFSGTFDFSSTKPYVERMVFAVPPQYVLSVGIPSGRTPRLQIVMSDARLPRVCEDANSTNCPRITATIAQVVTNNAENKLDCSSKYLADIEGTLKGERLREVCSTYVENGVATTDPKGLADFENFTIHGPAGKYSVDFTIGDVATNSEITLVNPVVALLLYSGQLIYSEKMHFKVGEPLPVQPTILRRDFELSTPTLLHCCAYSFRTCNPTGTHLLKVIGNGAKPLEGVTVKAFASSIPSEAERTTSSPWRERGTYPFPGERHATLTHATAVSNAQGLATFTELTVAGTSDSVVYISFFANGKLLSWSGNKNLLETSKFRTPLIVEFEEGASTTIITRPSPEVIEGVPFEQQPKVQVKPARAGRIVYAVVVSKDGFVLPSKLTSPFGKPEIAVKRFINAKAVTDASGIATFENLAFQAGGNAGTYMIEFWCDGNGTIHDENGAYPSVIVQVTSSIAKVQVAGEKEVSGDGDATLVQQTAIVSLKVTSSDGFGCPGKTPTSVSLFRSVSDGDSRSLVPVSEETEAAVRIAAVPSHSTARAESAFTGQDGIVQLNVYFTFITVNASANNFFLQFDFDHGAMSSSLIGPLTKAVASDQARTAAYVSSLVTIQAPPEEIEVKKPFEAIFQLRNSEGSTDKIIRTAKNEGLRMMICQFSISDKFLDPDAQFKFGIAVSSAPAYNTKVSWRLVTFVDTRKQAPNMKDEQIRDCVCQGTTFSQSAFSVGRALDTTHTTCGEGSQGITVTGVSDMFTSSVVNPVQYFVPYVAVNDDTGGARIFAQNDYYKPVLKLQEEDYAHKDPHHRAVLHLYFGVVDSNIAGLNGQAKDVKVQWIELPDSVPILEDINARYVGGLQMSECPEGGSVFPDIVREGIKCFQNSNCDDPTVTKQTAYGRIDRFDPLCYSGCIDSPFIILEHRVSGSYTYLDVLPGAWDVKIAINAPGRYAIRLEVDGIASPILFFEARSSAARLDVVVQAQPRVDGNASNPGDIFDIQPVAKLYDADGNPVQGERVQFDFVNDDGSLAPASGDLTPRKMREVLEGMSDYSKGFRYPLGHNLGSRQSRPSAADGTAIFDYAGFIAGRSGCYRMVFSVPVGDGTVIFAKRSDAPDSPIFISDPVCLVNEDAVKKAGEPDKLGAVGSLFKEKATFKLEYDLQGTNSTRTFGFKRRFWKRMNVDLAQFQVHSQNAVRKMEPWLQQLLNQGQISNDAQAFRTGDGNVGRILTEQYFANTFCLFYMGDAVLGGCTAQELRKPAQRPDTTTKALPEAILYDFEDGSIELVYSCEYIPYVANVPGAPDTEWSKIREYAGAIYVPPQLVRLPAMHDPFVTPGVSYDAQARWEKYHQSCQANFGVNTRPPANSTGVAHRLNPSDTKCEDLFKEDHVYKPTSTDQYSSLPVFVPALQWSSPDETKINLPGMPQVDLSNVMRIFSDLRESEHPVYAERIFTSSNVALPLVIGRKTSAFAERIRGPKLTFDNIKASNLRLKEGQNGDQLTVKLYGSLVKFMPNAYNLRTIDPSLDTSCEGPGPGLGDYGDCCDDHAGCQEGYVCHPVEHACTIECSTNYLYVSQLMSAARECPPEPLTQLSLCQPMTKTVSKTYFVDDAEGADRLNTTAPEYVWLCRARKAVGSSFSPFCSTCRNLLVYEHALADWNNGSVTTSALEGVAGNWVGDTKLQPDKKNKFDIQALFNLLAKAQEVPSAVLENIQQICNLVPLTCEPIQRALDTFAGVNPDMIIASSATMLMGKVMQKIDILCDKGAALLPIAAGLTTVCKKTIPDMLIDVGKCLGQKLLSAADLSPDVPFELQLLGCVIDQSAVFNLFEDNNVMEVALKSGVFRPIVVDSSPANVWIMANPPSTVILREPFTLSVQVTIQSGDPLPGQLVTIYIGNSEPTKRDPKELFLESSGEEIPELDPKLVTAAIDPLQTSAYTGSDGIARFRLRFLTGLEGQYTLYAKAGKITSQKSDPFLLENTIARVEWLNSLQQNLTLAPPTVTLIRFQDQGKVEFPFLKELEVQPKVRVLNQFGNPLPPDSERDVKFMLTRYQSSETNLLNEGMTLKDKFPNMNALQRAQGIVQLFMQGARQFNFIPVTKPKAKVIDTKSYTQNNLGEITWNDLSLSINEPAGQYRMAIVVDGVSSPYSDVITVTVEEPTKYEWILIQYLIQFIIFIMTGLILIGNSAWHSPLMLLASAATCIVCIVLAASNYLSPAVGAGYTDWTKNLLIIFLSTLLAWGVKMTAVEILSQRRNDHDADVRGLRPRTSCAYFFFNFASNRRHTYFRYVRRMFYKARDSKSEKALIRPNGADPSTYEKHAAKFDDPEFSDEELLDPQREWSILRRFLTLKNYDAVFLPQRVLLSFFAAIFVLIIMFLNVLKVFIALESSVYNAGNIAITTMLSGLAAFVRFFYEKSGTDLYDADGGMVIDNMLDQANEVHLIMSNIVRKIKISYVIGFVISAIFFLYTWVHLIFNFRNKVLRARRGIWTFDPSKVRLADASNFTGISISNGLMSFVYITFIFAAVVFVLVWETTYQILWFAITTFWYIWVPLVAVGFANFLFKKIVVYNIITKQMTWDGWQRPGPGDFLLRRALFHAYDLWLLIARLVTGIVTAIVRFGLTVAVALVTLPSASTSPLPAWIERYTLLDSGSKSFQAVVKAYHKFHNPIFRVACWLLVEDSQQRRLVAGKAGSAVVTVEKLCGKIKLFDPEEKQDVEAKDKADDSKKQKKEKEDTKIAVKTRRHSGLGVLRWRLAIMLHRFPHLRYYRSHYLAKKGHEKPNIWRSQVSRYMGEEDAKLLEEIDGERVSDPEFLLGKKATTDAVELANSLQSPSGLAMLQRKADSDHGGNIAAARAAIIDSFQAKQKSILLESFNGNEEKENDEATAVEAKNETVPPIIPKPQCDPSEEEKNV